MLFFYGVCILGAILTGHGAFCEIHVNLTSTRNAISPGSTPNLTVRCSVCHNTEVKADVFQVTALFVLRKKANTEVNETVATITALGLRAHLDLDKLKVTGNITAAEPYLQLTWTNPSSHQAGVYFCEVFGANSGQLPVILTESLQIHDLHEPSTEELLLYIADLDRRTRSLESKLDDVEGVNVQTGSIRCAQGVNDYTIQFDPPFEKVPTVITAVAGLQSSDDFVKDAFVWSLSSVGFLLNCNSHGTTDIIWVAL